MTSNSKKTSNKMLNIFSISLFVLLGALLIPNITATAVAADEVSIRMNWYWSGIHAPFFLAMDRGYYNDNGIDIKIEEGRG